MNLWRIGIVIALFLVQLQVIAALWLHTQNLKIWHTQMELNESTGEIIEQICL